MNTTDLKIFAMCYVMEHDNLLKEEKIAVMEFIKEADLDQIKYLLATGEVKSKLEKSDLKILDEMEVDWGIFKQLGQLAVGKDYEKGILVGGSTAIKVAAATAAITTIAYKAYKRFLSKAARACKGKSGVEKTNCMNKYKYEAQKAKINVLQQGLSKCTQTKDPATCKVKIQAKLNKEKAKLGQL